MFQTLKSTASKRGDTRGFSSPNFIRQVVVKAEVGEDSRGGTCNFQWYRILKFKRSSMSRERHVACNSKSKGESNR